MLQALCVSPVTSADGVEFQASAMDPHVGQPVARNSLERIARIDREGEALIAALQVTNDRLKRARDYLASAGSNPVLGRALVKQLRDRKSWLLARVRANRIAACAVLGVLETQL